MIDSINKLSNSMINLENQLNNTNENNINNIKPNIDYSLIEQRIKHYLINLTTQSRNYINIL